MSQNFYLVFITFPSDLTGEILHRVSRSVIYDFLLPILRVYTEQTPLSYENKICIHVHISLYCLLGFI